MLRVLGCVPDRGWLVMELCAGGSLKARAMRRVFSSYAVPTCVKKPISVWLHHSLGGSVWCHRGSGWQTLCRRESDRRGGPVEAVVKHEADVGTFLVPAAAAGAPAG